jgi:hypothetical protein
MTDDPLHNRSPLVIINRPSRRETWFIGWRAWSLTGAPWLAENCDAKRYGAATARILREACSEAGKDS